MHTPHDDQATHKGAQRARSRRRARSAGAVMVEYAFLLVFFGVPVMVATAALGINLIRGYGAVRNDQLHVGP